MKRRNTIRGESPRDGYSLDGTWKTSLVSIGPLFSYDDKCPHMRTVFDAFFFDSHFFDKKENYTLATFSHDTR